MKQNITISILLILLTLTLAACNAFKQEPATVTPIPTLSLQPTSTQIQETVVSQPDTPTPTRPTVTPTRPTATVTAVPTSGQPVLHTQGATNVRLGPGMIFNVSHVLSANSIVPIIGKNLESTWWVVPGLGDGPGKPGWVSGAVVTVQGDLSQVPFVAPPTLTPTPNPPAFPIMGNGGLPPGGDTCVVVHPGPGDLGPTVVRLGPGYDYVVTAHLGLNRWAAIAEAQSGWYRIVDASGLGGWVHQSEVAFAGRCSAPGSGPDLPLVENPGSPPSNRCLVSRPGQFPPPGIHLGPGRQFALTARLGNWAEVLSSEIGWHQILLGPGQVGWIDGADVELIGTCSTPEPVPQRIQFEPGAISAIVNGALQPPQRDQYLFRAMAGQHTIIEIHSTDGRANFMLSGVNDGQPYKRLEDEQRIWGAELPTTQDYLLTVAAPAQAPFTEYSFELIIRPLDSQTP
jgi:uncharacterized protein YgiM (DUF1202 family)